MNPERARTTAASASIARPVPGVASPRLVGRTREIDVLLSALAQPPSITFVEGEAGIGKTRLLTHVLADPSLRGRTIMMGRCQPLTEPWPLGPVVEAVRGVGDGLPRSLNTLLGCLHGLLPELADRLPPALTTLDDPLAERHRVLRALTALLESIGPAVLVVEDVHWVDQRSAEFLLLLSARLPQALSLVLSYRGEDAALHASPLLAGLARPGPGVFTTRLAVPPLDLGDVRDLVAAVLSADDVSEEFAEHLREQSGGIPFVVEELLRLFRDQGIVLQRDGVWVRRSLDDPETPRGVRDPILARMARLSPDARRVTEAAAVFGVPVSEELLSLVSELQGVRLEEAVASALDASLLLHDGRAYAFRHPLARDCVYGGITPLRRKRFHLVAAHALEGLDPPATPQLPRHYRAAGRERDWVRCAEAAAEAASVTGDDSSAALFLFEALEARGLSPVVRVGLATLLARTLSNLTRAEVGVVLERAVENLRRSVEDPTLPTDARGSAHLWLGRLALLFGNGMEARAHFSRAEDALRRRPTEAVPAMRALAFPWSMSGTFDEHRGWLERVAEIEGAESPTTRYDRATLLLAAGVPEGWDAVERMPRIIDERWRRRELIRTLANLSEVTLVLGHPQRARAFLEEATALEPERHYMRTLASIEALDAAHRYYTGAWQDLGQRAERVIESHAHYPMSVLFARLVRGLLAVAREEPADARALLEQVVSEAEGAGSPPLFAAGAGGLARVLCVRGEDAAAVDVTMRAIAVIRHKQMWTWGVEVVPWAVDALLADGQGEDARAIVDEFALGTAGRDSPASHAVLEHVRGALAVHAGRTPTAARSFSRAAAAWKAIGRAYDAALARERAGDCLIASDASRGKRLLHEALDSFLGLAATRDAARVRRLLATNGDSLGSLWPRGRRSYGANLSPQEFAAVKLLAAGRSGKDIAAELYLSARTVEGHLGRAMGKFEVHSRAALVSRFIEQQRAPLAGESDT